MGTQFQVTTCNHLTNHVATTYHRLPNSYPLIYWKAPDFHCLQLYRPHNNLRLPQTINTIHSLNSLCAINNLSKKDFIGRILRNLYVVNCFNVLSYSPFPVYITSGFIVSIPSEFAVPSTKGSAYFPTPLVLGLTSDLLWPMDVGYLQCPCSVGPSFVHSCLSPSEGHASNRC